MLQQGSIQEGFPWEVTCKLGRGHASTMWLEHGCAQRGAVGGEARVQPTPSSYGSALYQDPAQSNRLSPNAGPSNFVQLQVWGPLYHLHYILSFGNPALPTCSPPQEGPLLPFTFHPACLSRLPPQKFPRPHPLPKSRPFSLQSLGASPLTCRAFSKSGFSVQVDVELPGTGHPWGLMNVVAACWLICEAGSGCPAPGLWESRRKQQRGQSQCQASLGLAPSSRPSTQEVRPNSGPSSGRNHAPTRGG